jgi:hypothetical protein
VGAAEYSAVETVDPVKPLLIDVPEWPFPECGFHIDQNFDPHAGLPLAGEAWLRQSADAEAVNGEDAAGFSFSVILIANRPRHRGDVGDVEIGSAESNMVVEWTGRPTIRSTTPFGSPEGSRS